MQGAIAPLSPIKQSFILISKDFRGFLPATCFCLRICRIFVLLSPESFFVFYSKVFTVQDKTTGTFRLRPVEKSDLEVIAPWFQDVEDLALFDRTSRIPFNQSQTEEIWKDAFSPDNRCKCWFVVESSDGKALGMAGIEAISTVNRDAVIAMFVEKNARRLGIGLRATALLIDFAFRQLGLNRLTSYYRVDNQSSRDLVARVGCQIEGTMRQAWFADGKFHDMIVVGVLNQDWMKHRETLAQELSNDIVVTFGTSAPGAWSWPPQGAGS